MTLAAAHWAGRSAPPAPHRGRTITEVPFMDFANFTERARGILQAAQMEALAGRHQNCIPEHLLKALLDDGEGLAARIVRDAGGDPDLLKTAAEERLERLDKVPGNGPFPVYMTSELATVLQGAV